ncbi:MAG: hypothetical protein Fur0021_08080 [Candidatus Promineifilaceae bacterium]
MRWRLTLSRLLAIDSQDVEVQQNGRLLQILILSLLLPTTIATLVRVVVFLIEMATPARIAMGLPLGTVLLTYAYNWLITFVCLWLIRRGRPMPALHIHFIALDLVLLYLLISSNSHLLLPLFILPLLPIIGASLLGEVRNSLPYTAFALLVVPAILSAKGQSALEYIVANLVLILAIWTFSDRLNRNLRDMRKLTQDVQTLADTLQQRVAAQTTSLRRRAEQLQHTVEVGRAASASLDLNQLMQDTTELIRSQFGFYHASIFLLDATRQQAVVRESTGPVGEIMKQQQHTLPVGSDSLVGWAAANRQARIARDVGTDPVHFSNPLLPETRSDAVLPLIVRGELLGILDVQSREVDAFQPEDIAILQLMADQLASNIDNARLYAESQRRADLLSHLPEIAALMNQQANTHLVLNVLVQRSMALLDSDGAAAWLWQPESQQLELIVGYVQGKPATAGIRLAAGQGLPGQLFAANKTLIINDYAAWADVSPTATGSMRSLAIKAALAVPLRQGDECIGVLALTRSHTERLYTAEEAQFLESLALLSSIIVRNSQLLHETRRLVQREQMINQITANIQRNLDLNAILDTAAAELGAAIGNPQVHIRLFPPAPPTETTPNAQ